MMSSLILSVLMAGATMNSSVDDPAVECKMIPQADESQSIELCANEKQWKSIAAKVGGDIGNLRCIYLDKAGSSEPVRACGTMEQLAKKMGTASMADVSDIRCKSVTEVRSRIPKKVCLSEKRWAEIARDNREDVQNELRDSLAN